MVAEGYDIPEIPVNLVQADSFEQAKKIVLSLTSQFGKMTDYGLKAFLSDANLNFDVLDDLRFPEIDIDEFIKDMHGSDPVAEGNTDDDDIPNEAPQRVKYGHIWQLERHRLICGDSTDLDTVSALMGGDQADMVFTDPPYGVSYVDKNKFLNSIDGGEGNRIEKPIENDHKSASDIYSLWCEVFKIIHDFSKDTCSYYICSPQGGEQMLMMQAIEFSSFSLKHTLIWVKNNHALGRCDYNYKHEPILYGWKKKGTHKFYGNGQCKTSVWPFDKPMKNDLHPTMKPVELVVEAILNSSKDDDIVIDPFLGSGTSLIACEKTNRKCYGIEIDPRYCDIILQRWEAFTGKKAMLI